MNPHRCKIGHSKTPFYRLQLCSGPLETFESRRMPNSFLNATIVYLCRHFFRRTNQNKISDIQMRGQVTYVLKGTSFFYCGLFPYVLTLGLCPQNNFVFAVDISRLLLMISTASLTMLCNRPLSKIP